MSDAWGAPGAPGQPEPTVGDPASGQPPAPRNGVLELASHPAALFRLGLFPTLGAVVAIGLMTALGGLNTILLSVVIALFAALGLQPLIDWFVRRGLPRWAAAGLVAAAFIALAALAIAAMVPVVVNQSTAMITEVPAAFEALRRNRQIAELDARYGVLASISDALASGAWVTQLFGGVLGAGLAAANLMVSLVLTVVLTLYFLWSAPQVKDAIYALAPASKRPRVRYLATEIFQRIGDYLLAMLAVMTLWGVLTFIVLTIVGLGQYALALALLVAGLAAIPAVGTTVGALICALLALSVSPSAALITLIALLGYQQVDAYLVQPRLFARSLKVPPVLVILGAACGLALFGLPGALLAIPTVASLLLLHREIIVPKLDAS